jgi:ribosome-associated protein
VNADPDRGVLRVTRTVAVPHAEIDVSFSPSGGPGGQHANRSSTRVELRFDVRSSQALGPRQRERIAARLGDVVRVSVDDERSQARNRALAYERLAARLAAALHVERRRRPTAPTRASQERRVEAKRRRSGVKSRRRRPSVEE